MNTIFTLVIYVFSFIALIFSLVMFFKISQINKNTISYLEEIEENARRKISEINKNAISCIEEVEKWKKQTGDK